MCYYVADDACDDELDVIPMDVVGAAKSIVDGEMFRVTFSAEQVHGFGEIE